MLCDVCKDSLEGIWDPLRTKRLELRENVSFFSSSSSTSSEESTFSAAAREVQKYVFGHHKTRDSFLHSTAAGCVQCSRYTAGKDTRNLGYFSIFCLRFNSENGFLVERRFGAMLGLHKMVPWAESPCAHELNLNLSLSTAHDTVWDLISRWFSTCTRSHNQCNALGINGSFLPRRLLKIDSTGETLFFQLVDSTDCAVESAYMTLSYCWGSQPASEVYRLLKTTVQAMRSKQPIMKLPKTIRDAMKIAEYFQVRYLWVDRLCIFQDSAEDFQREASSMADVYKNAILNIAALSAEDADGGCFFERNPRYIVPTLVRMQHDKDGISRAYLLDTDGQRGWQSAFETQPLIDRAWTVQERFLARRVIYFGNKQIFWECEQAHWCETHLAEGKLAPDIDETSAISLNVGRWDHIWQRLLGPNGSPFPPQTPLPEKLRVRDSYELLLLNWQRIVTLFSKCALSVPNDKLVALSGMANEMRRRLEELRPGTGHRYVAGLWEEELPGALAWYVSGEAYRAVSYRAPTWSWASIDGQVMFPSKTSYFPICFFSSIIAIAVRQPPGESETGQVENASITLLGPVLHTTVDLTTNTTETWANTRRPPDPTTFPIVSLHEDSYNGAHTYRNSGGKAPGQLGISHANVQFDTFEDIRQDVSQIIIQTDGPDVMGIAIAPGDMEPCTFKRVGIFRYIFGNWDGSWDSHLSKGSHEAQDFVKNIPKKSIVIV